MAVSFPPADDSDELDDEEPLLGAGATTAFACNLLYDVPGWAIEEINVSFKI